MTAAPTPDGPTTTVGTVASPWRGQVTRWGALDPGDGSERCDWWLSADDRWYRPEREPSRRHHRIDGAPVLETTVRVPGGDAVQRVYAVADHGGLTVVEVENRSPVPFALAVSRRDLLASRPPTTVAVTGRPAEVPATAAIYPVAHRTTLRLALAHDGTGPGALPTPPPPTADRVARGWRTLADRAGRLVVPDGDLGEQLVAARAAVVLDGPPGPRDDPVGFLLATAEGDRLGGGGPVDVVAVAGAAEGLARRHRRLRPLPWEVPLALAAAAVVLGRADEGRAAADVVDAMARLAPAAHRPAEAPAEAGRAAAWVTSGVVAPAPGGADLFAALPVGWYGQSVEAYELDVPAGRVSVAVRWHGARPALLWECSAPMTLTASALDPAWRVDATAAGEALLAPPPARP